MQQSELVHKRERQQVETEARAEGLRIGALHLTEELENARQAIGMDLHDQTLADLSRMARTLRKLDSQETIRGSEIEPVLDDMEHCIRELRVIIDNAKPSVLQLFGLGDAVEALLERSVGSSQVPLAYELVDDAPGLFDNLHIRKVVTLYRIVQEAINNSVRHANARMIKVWFGRRDNKACVIIEDDGTGLDETSRRSTGGLSNMRTRASLIRAELTVSGGENGKGTRLELLLPIATPLDEASSGKIAQ